MGKILVVDDEPSVRRLLSIMLKRLNSDMIEAGSAEEALELINKKPDLDVLITDILMPGQDGVELANRVRETYPGLPVIYITGNSLGEKPALDDRSLFIYKPFTLQTISDAVTALSSKYNEQYP